MVILKGMHVMRMMTMMGLVSSIPPHYTCTENMQTSMHALKSREQDYHKDELQLMYADKG